VSAGPLANLRPWSIAQVRAPRSWATGVVWPEDVAAGAVSDVEIVADDGKHHRVGAIQELTILDRLHGEDGRELRRPSAVPAGTVASLRFAVVRLGHTGMITLADSEA